MHLTNGHVEMQLVKRFEVNVRLKLLRLDPAAGCNWNAAVNSSQFNSCHQHRNNIEVKQERHSTSKFSVKAFN